MLPALIGCVSFVAACDEEAEEATDNSAPEIVGSYDDSFGGTHIISATEWVQGTPPDTSSHAITFIDNDARVAVAQNATANAFFPDLWSRFEWTWDTDGQLRICQSVFDAADEDAAIDATGANDADLEEGCGGFSWTVLTPAEM